MQSRINAILSDYDGTLSPTKILRSNTEPIPKELEGVLWGIAQKIPVCIVSSKDYYFIHRRAKFAWILSCIMGIETIVMRIPNDASMEIEKGNNDDDNFNCIKERYLLPNIKKILETNSVTLSKLAEGIESEIKDNVIVARKYTSDGKYLAGITIDYRHLKNWNMYKNKLEPSLNEIIQRYRSSSSIPGSDLYIQTYRSHPFLDVYSGYCDKGMAFDLIATKILNPKENGEMYGGSGILYLGDSENDNPAFRKASISVGITSDKRLAPQLDCEYLIGYKHLPEFLRHLAGNRFMFSESLLTG
jgi:hydroxymethylpyrimidine pyrophosphatase-like HAD family hydrolase